MVKSIKNMRSGSSFMQHLPESTNDLELFRRRFEKDSYVAQETTLKIVRSVTGVWVFSPVLELSTCARTTQDGCWYQISEPIFSLDSHQKKQTS